MADLSKAFKVKFDTTAGSVPMCSMDSVSSLEETMALPSAGESLKVKRVVWLIGGGGAKVTLAVALDVLF